MTEQKSSRLVAHVLKWVLPPTILILVLSSALFLNLNQKALESEIEARLEHMLSHSKDLLLESIDSVITQTSTLAANELVRNGLIDTQERYRYLPAMFRSLGRISGSGAMASFSLLDFQGLEIISNDVSPAQTVKNQDANHLLEADQNVFMLNRQGLLFAAPIHVHGFVEGAVQASLSYQGLADLFSGWNNLDYAVALISPEQEIILANQRHPQDKLAHKGNNGKWIAAHETLSDGYLRDYQLTVGLPADNAFAGSRRLRLLLLTSLGLGTLGVITAIVITGRMTASPVAGLNQALSDLSARKDLSSRLPARGPREIQELAQSFNSTLSSLEKTFTSRERLDQLISSSPSLIYALDPENLKPVFVSSNIREIYEYSPEEILGNSRWWLAHLHPEDRDRAVSAIKEWKDSGASGLLVHRYRMRTRTGRWLHIEDRLRAVQDKNSRISEFIGTHMDISSQVRMQEELRANEEKYRSLMEQSMEMMYVHDLQGNFLEVNQKAVDRTGYSREELLRMQVFDLHTSDFDRHRIISAWQDLAPGSSISTETVHVTRSGQEFPVEISIGKITYGPHTHILALVRDITEARKARAEIIEARDRAEAASRAKSEFLANMSHEIRTPMAGILGSLEMILDRSADPEQEKLLKMTLDSAASLQQIINDILDLSKVEAGKMNIEIQEFSPAQVVNRVIHLFKIQAGSKNILLHAELADNYPPMVQGDPYRLEQILRNLVSNAVKFTSKGEIILRSGVKNPGHDPLDMYFQVQDTGPGIAEDFQKSIFESFSQADSTYAKQFQGTGLGLAISSSLAGMMNGSIDLSSRPGQGSTFTLNIPLTPVWKKADADQEQEPEQDAGLSCSENLHILLAEDMELNQAFITHLLARQGHQTMVAANGREALRLFESEKFDLILMDIQMPEMDGVQVTRRIRELEKGSDSRFSGHVPIIALTAYAMAEEKEKFLAAGMDGYVAKPVNKEKLLREICRVVTLHPPLEDQAGYSASGLETEPEKARDIPVDLEEINNKYSGHHSFWKGMFKRFVDEDLPGYIQELQTCAAENDLDSLFAVAHKLKGGLGTLCALQAAEKAAALDNAVRNHLAEDIPEALDSLLAELDRLPPYRNTLS